MLVIPFPLERLPVAQVEAALNRLRAERPKSQPILLGDVDVFSAEWAETVDTFEEPAAILSAARALDIDAWFAERTLPPPPRSDARREGLARRLSTRLFARPDPVVALPSRRRIDALKDHARDLEASGESSVEELAEIREIIRAVECGDAPMMFPDPIDYVTPRRGDEMVAGLVDAAEPWESMAWLQHGTYAVCAPRPVLVACCRWLWHTPGARIITASTDHIGFQVERPIARIEDAREVLRRVALLGASEVNGDTRHTSGETIVGAARLWVWWD